MTEKFDAIIFDCDGVLVDSEALSIVGERAALSEMGLDYEVEDYVARFVGMHDTPFIAALKDDFRARHGAPAPEDFEDRLMAGRRREMHKLTAIDGAADALIAARAHTPKVAVASSARAQFLTNKLQKTGLLSLVAPHVYSADLVARAKPAPDIFLYAGEKIGADPARTLVLEDSENGVRAGCAAGMTVWGFLGGGHCTPGHGDRLTARGAHRIVAGFAEFIDRIS